MVTRIDQLTPEQEAAMGPWAEKWIKKVLCTDTTDWDAFGAAAKECYGYAGAEWPNILTRMQSPLAVSYAAPIVSLMAETNKKATKEAVMAAINPVVPKNIREDIFAAITETSDKVFGKGRKKVREELTTSELRSAVRDRWHLYLGGTFWLSWQAYTSFFREVCDLELPGDLWQRDIAYGKAQEAVGWWWPNEAFLVASDRPSIIELEETNERGWKSYQLHSEVGPALQYRDGWGIWSWHGVRVPQYVIERPDEITATDIINDANAEVARVKLERMGIDRFVDESKARVIDEDDHYLKHPEMKVISGSADPRVVYVDRMEHRRLLSIDMPNDPDRTVTVVEVTCPSTDHRYLLRVPPSIRTAQEAVAWTASTKPDTYKMAAEA